MIKNIVFDIGNVLVRFQPDEAMREIGIEENKIAVSKKLIFSIPSSIPYRSYSMNNIITW